MAGRLGLYSHLLAEHCRIINVDCRICSKYNTIDETQFIALIIATNTFVFYQRLIHRKVYKTQYCFATAFGKGPEYVLQEECRNGCIVSLHHEVS